MGSIENDTIEEVIQYFNEVLHKDIEKLHPLKGQRIFNPRFYVNNHQFCITSLT